MRGRLALPINKKENRLKRGHRGDGGRAGSKRAGGNSKMKTPIKEKAVKGGIG